MIYVRVAGLSSRGLYNAIKELTPDVRPTMPQGELAASDLIVTWGEVPVNPSCRVLNGIPFMSKLTELKKLAAAEVLTPIFTDKDPAGTNLAGEWFGRRSNHQQGRDFRQPPASPAFWVKRVKCVKEWRLHVFKHADCYEVVRRAERVPSTPNHHPWVRSRKCGWKLSYNSNELPKGLRALARNAVKAVGLDFGAVDCGQLEDGTLLVFEVNRRPRLEAETPKRYAPHIVKFYQEGLGGTH